MQCSMSNNYIRKAASQNGIVHLQGEVLNDIQASLQICATYGILTEDLFTVRYRIETQKPLALFLRDVRTAGGRFLDAPQRVFIINDMNWRANPGLTGRPSNRGRYLYASAAILLHEKKNGDEKNAWCRKTLIHEILHSASIYSRVFDRFPNISRLHYFLIEGITECLTGYILLKCHPRCYNGWKTNQMDRCSISYREHVRLWCSFCQCVGIRDIADFYLSSQENPSDAWNQLVQSVQAKGFGTFNYQLDPGRAFNEPQFRQVCVDSLPNFRETYESLSKCLDFSRISE